ncbi:hypothetical protein D3C72_1084750 [compost metagenome]
MQRQDHAKRRAHLRLAAHFQAAAHFAQVFAAFEHADAHARRLGRIERFEQAFADELLAHALPRIVELDDGRVLLAPQPHSHLAIAGRRFDGVLDQMAQHPFQARAVGQHRQLAIDDFQPGRRGQAGLGGHGLAQQAVEQQRRGRFRRFAARQFLQQGLHFLHRMIQGAQHVFLEGGIGAVLFRIAQ